ncbi:inositol monophosphatase family protein [Aspergillus novofumigatus IBT 16806]|uniref:Inositol-1-monophosphatase n=1 Tax=Aspergillus novofumigatus (strain IBT 16806) TaxID=1392255 RepID=A0A2I1C998_ASPN1|nr:putative inositol monophosphatase QutG [Aspergillus novofumigatus IBT 16806]PKX94212.1 putative inositol monophosphatase QutG [Aspergillus novofumigatus IBT 16806]
MAIEFTQAQLDEIYAFAVDLGRKAGDLLLERLDRQIAGDGHTAYTEKDNAVDIVTQTDEDVETFIKTAIQERYPEHKFLGEETYAQGESRSYLIDAHPTWCIDPLDGTVNFTHLFPMFCVSIGFLVSHRPVIGVIYAPATNQLFSSCVNRGAWLNDPRGSRRLPLRRNPIPPMPATSPRGCIFACEWGKDRRDIPGGNLSRKVESFVSMAAESGGMVHGVRSLGSAALDLAYTAMGAVDIWDVAAGRGLVTTANPPANPQTDPIEEVGLGSRLYLAVRPAGPSETETGRQTQERTVREVWKRVRELDYTRPGA